MARFCCLLKQVVPDYPGDHCAFEGPIARLVYNWHHVDIYYLTDLGMIFYDELKDLHYKKTDIHPLVTCSFMGVSTWCPKNPRAPLEKLYGNIEPEKVCVDGRWVSIKKN